MTKNGINNIAENDNNNMAEYILASYKKRRHLT